MIMSRRVFAAGAALGATIPAQPASANPRRLAGIRHWGVYYGSHLTPADIGPCEMLVLDQAFQGALPSFRRTGVKALGYLSLGEFDMRSRAASGFDASLILQSNKIWTGAVAVDVRRPEWTEFVLRTLLPTLKERQFDGLFLDTLDTPPHLEQTGHHEGMRQAAIDLVFAVRAALPHGPILMNRGYALLPEVEPAIDGVVAESLLTTYDFAQKRYHWVADQDLQWHLDALSRIRSKPIFSLDYWDPSDLSTIETIRERERALGHAPYVATIALDRFVSASEGSR